MTAEPAPVTSTSFRRSPSKFHPYPDVPVDAVDIARRIVRAAHIDIGGIEYVTTRDGRRVFYDVNAN